jgi:hypothetical protein
MSTLRVTNPITGRAIRVSALPSSVFMRLWLDHGARRQLVRDNGRRLLDEVVRLGIDTPPTPLRFILLPSGREGVDNRFLYASKRDVRVARDEIKPGASVGGGGGGGGGRVKKVDDTRGGDDDTDGMGETVGRDDATRAALRRTEPACLLDPGRLAYQICTTSGTLSCGALRDAEFHGRVIGTRESIAVANTARELRAKFCSGPPMTEPPSPNPTVSTSTGRGGSSGGGARKGERAKKGTR